MFDKITQKLKAMFSAIRKPRSKYRKARGSWLKFNRRYRLEINPLLANMPEHPFKPLKKLAIYKVNNGHNYTRDILKLRKGKLKPKQIRILNYKLQAAGITIDD